MLRRHPLASFFTLAYGLTAIGIAVLTVPAVTGSRPPDTRALAVFPVMVLGVGVVGVGLTAALGGRRALRDLLAGLAEEFAWTGFALPRMVVAMGMPAAAVLLGVLWGLWHLPVVDYLGAAHPHDGWWAAFFAAFIAVLTALRVLIATVYLRTGSLLLAQLLHASSTGCLAMLGPAHVTPRQEALWYAGYALALAVAAAAMWKLVSARRQVEDRSALKPVP
jgi:CAAX protease family protein